MKLAVLHQLSQKQILLKPSERTFHQLLGMDFDKVNEIKF